MTRGARAPRGTRRTHERIHLRRVRFIAVVLATAIVFYGGRAISSRHADLRCRGAVATNFRMVVREGFRALDACHARRDAGHLHGDCNQLFSLVPSPPAFASLLTGFRIEAARASGIISVNCSDAGLVANYPNTIASGDISNVVGMAILKEIELSGAGLQGAPDLAGQAKARPRCHAAIGRARTAIVLDTIRSASRCERRLDRSLGEFGAIAADCLGRTTRVTSRARARLARVCAGIAGQEVGSCGPLPDCVVAEAVRAGETLVRDFYGATPAQRQALCGNGFVDLGEECDDGNTDPTDACTDTCQNAFCGDGIVEVGVEQCDEGSKNSDFGFSTCNKRCMRTSCGDGIVQPGEECDDGNNIPNDGCTNCVLDPVPCNADGLDVRACLAKDQFTDPNVAGVTVNVVYPPPLTIPGSGISPTVRQRVTDLTGGVGLSTVVDRDENQDGTDETLRNAYVTTPPKTVPYGPFELIHFDCPAGTPIATHDIHCTVPDAADTLGQTIQDATNRPMCVLGIAPHGGALNVNCPTP